MCIFQSGLHETFFEDPVCIEDCLPDCLKSLIADYKLAGGVCANSFMTSKIKIGAKDYEVDYSGYWPVSTKVCTMGPEYEYPSNAQNAKFKVPSILNGLCSEKTEELLRNGDVCNAYSFYKEKEDVYETVKRLVVSMCTTETFEVWDGLQQNARLLPIDEIGGDVPHLPPFHNTRHRYPWICSLRSKTDSSHLCGTTLLARPPKPTVIVGVAHCTFVCKGKASGNIQPNCCCENVSGQVGDCTGCEVDAETQEITGEDAEIVCGEWQTGQTSMSASGEQYNAILPIKNIIRHPDYEIVRGEQSSQYVSADLAVFMVDDTELTYPANHRIYPACIPKGTNQAEHGIHSGWSAAPPTNFLDNSVDLCTNCNTGYQLYEEEFRKQWHYNMSISVCKDPDVDFYYKTEFKHPTNSYYPEATICAAEVSKRFCPTSGESGSPLMTKVNGRYTAVGLQSFVKVG